MVAKDGVGLLPGHEAPLAVNADTGIAVMGGVAVVVAGICFVAEGIRMSTLLTKVSVAMLPRGDHLPSTNSGRRLSATNSGCGREAPTSGLLRQVRAGLVVG